MRDDDHDDHATALVKTEQMKAASIADIISDAPAAPPIEMAFDRVTVEGSFSERPAPHRMLEIWSRNHVYTIDSNLTCIEVTDRKTGRPDQKHSVLGTHLAGGRRQYGKTLHHTTPFPVPGTEAIFDKLGDNGRRVQVKATSTVERVVQLIRVTTIVLINENAWDDVTNALLNPSSGRPPTG